mmetsp:Transcript_46044/g.144848  ORF Transcript_46044/g.144848 Transcript_46044/m.144848 type:complete len:132 (+) Transcript_46044:1193-1588(+)
MEPQALHEVAHEKELHHRGEQAPVEPPPEGETPAAEDVHGGKGEGTRPRTGSGVLMERSGAEESRWHEVDVKPRLLTPHFYWVKSRVTISLDKWDISDSVPLALRPLPRRKSKKRSTTASLSSSISASSHC